MRCRNCGSEVDEGASFCGNCGSNNLIDMSKINNKAVAPANAVEVNNAAPVNAAPMAKATPMVNAAPMANAAPAANYNQVATYEEKPKATRSKGEVINRVMGIIIGVANFGVIALLFSNWFGLSYGGFSLDETFSPLEIYKVIVILIKSGAGKYIPFWVYLGLIVFTYFFLSSAILLFCSSYRLFTDHCYASMQRRGLRNALFAVLTVFSALFAIPDEIKTDGFSWFTLIKSLCSIWLCILVVLVIVLMILSKIWIINSRYDFNQTQRKIYNTITRLMALGIIVLFLYLVGAFASQDDLIISLLSQIFNYY